MKNIVNIIVKVAIVLFVLSLFSEYLNDIPELKSFAKLNYDSTYTKITFCIGYMFFVYFLIKKQSYFPSTSNIITITIVYSAYRFSIIPHSKWEFIHLSQSVYYLDGVYLFIILLLSRCYHKSKITSNNETLEHNPIDAINSDKDDKFGFYNDAKQLTNLILNQKKLYQNTSMIIGLRGEWGEGKTSYLNMLALYAKEHKSNEINIMRFNPWYSNSYEQMVKDLFVEFSNTYGCNITNKEFNSYIKALSDVNIGVWSKITKLIYISQDKTLTELHDQLNNIIKSHSNINIVLIDDLDRLNESEILNVFKLIRNNADFAKTVFIVSYDYEYIKSTLKNIENIDKYIEKIFPCPYILPECNRDVLKDLKKSRMLDIMNLDKRFHQSLDEFINNIGENISLRNAQRVALQVAYNTSNLKDRDGNLMVNLCDYLSLSYLSIIAPKVYKNIAHTNTEYDKDDLLVNYSGCIYMNFDRSLFSKYKKEENEKYISEKEYTDKIKNLGLNGIVTADVFHILTKMFNRSDHNTHQINHKLFRFSRVSDTKTLSMFLTRNTDNALLTKAEFDRNWDSNDSQLFINSIRLWVTKYDKYSLSYQIANMQLKTKEDWKEAFDAVINIYPLSVFERFKNIENPDILRYVTIPGEDMVDDLKRDSPEFIEYTGALLEYVQNINNDNAEKIRRKYVMLDSPFVRNIVKDINYNNSSIESSANEYNNLVELTSFDIDEVRENNIKTRLSRIDSYDEFHSEYWFDCHNFEFEAKVKIRNIFKDHIANHLDSFITNYSIDIIANDIFIRELFYKYEVDGYQIEINDKEWLPYFISFLEGINDKDKRDERINTYLDGVKTLMETQNK